MMSVSPLILCCLIFSLDLSSIKGLENTHKRGGICRASAPYSFSSIQRGLCWMLCLLIYTSLPLTVVICKLISNFILESPNFSGTEKYILAPGFLVNQCLKCRSG